MFILGVFIILAWIFSFFYYDDMVPQTVSVGMIIAGLFSMGWGLLVGKR